MPMAARPDPRREPVAWLRWAYSLLDATECIGCTACADKCAGAFGMWHEEFVRMRAAAEAAGIEPQPLEAGDEWSACPMLDPQTRLCLVYLARPLVCRAFGLVPWLPCPTGRARGVDERTAQTIMADYASRPRKTYWQWLNEE